MKWLQTYTLDRKATGIGLVLFIYIYFHKFTIVLIRSNSFSDRMISE